VLASRPTHYASSCPALLDVVCIAACTRLSPSYGSTRENPYTLCQGSEEQSDGTSCSRHLRSQLLSIPVPAILQLTDTPDRIDRVLLSQAYCALLTLSTAMICDASPPVIGKHARSRESMPCPRRTACFIFSISPSLHTVSPSHDSRRRAVYCGGHEIGTAPRHANSMP
jgi:hypothetical protein